MRHPDDVVLIGPPCVGKTTVGAQLAARLEVPHHELDALRREFYSEIGFDMAFSLELLRTQGWATLYQYWKVFDPHAIERLVERNGVLDLGGGAPIAEHPGTADRIERALAPFDHVVALIPDPDVERSLEILSERAEPDVLESCRYFLDNPMYGRLATHTVYTGTRGPEAVVDEVLALWRGADHQRDSEIL